MNILWLTWKDLKHPLAGGAEVVNEELAKRLAKDGHEVIFIVGGYQNTKPKEKINGYSVVRLGNRYSVYWKTYRYYKKYLIGWADLVIDEVNTIPFFAKFYVKERNILFVHQLARKIWFYEMKFPLSLIGYALEPLYLRMLSKQKVITISESTKKDLIRYGFKQNRINIISEGIQLEPLKSLSHIKKNKQFTILSLGALRPMKRTLDIVKAFELLPEVLGSRLIIAGDTSSRYAKKILKYIHRSPKRHSIEILGRVSQQKKVELMQKSHLLAVTSIKEGWCLTVTEANSQGTPAVVYDVDGLRDSVRHGKTGLITKKNSPNELAENISELFKNKQRYNAILKASYAWSKVITFDNSYRDLKQVIKT